MQIEGKTFLITGAGSGLGAAVADMITGAGGNVLIADVNAEAGAAKAEALGDKARFCQTDVTSDSAGRAAVAAAVEAFGGLDGVINCAGVAPGEKILGRSGAHDLDNFARAVSINLVGSFNMYNYLYIISIYSSLLSHFLICSSSLSIWS